MLHPMHPIHGPNLWLLPTKPIATLGGGLPDVGSKPNRPYVF